MSFLSPWFLLALPMASVPLLIHLFSRRQQKRIGWGAMRFLVQAATRKRRLWRLTDWLLLLLRTAAFLCLILALARPLLPATWLGGGVPRQVILILDQSLSTSRRAGGMTCFERELQHVSRLLDELSGNDSVRVLLAGPAPEWLTPEPLPVNAATRRKLQAQLATVKPTLGGADLIACVREAADLESPKEHAARVIYVISDGQRFGWRLDEPEFWAAVQARVRHAPLPTTVGLVLVGNAEPEANLCVNQVSTPRALGAVGQALTFTASVQNHSPNPSAPTLLTWRINGEPAGIATVGELAPGAVSTFSLTHPFTAAGQFEVAAQLEVQDALTGDNDAQVVVEIFDRLPILVVEPNESAEAADDLPFLLAALGARQNSTTAAPWRSVFEPEVLTASNLITAKLDQFRCVLLSNVKSLPPEVVGKLERYVEAGGGVWLALGNQTDERFFNDQLYRGGMGLAPLRLLAPVGDPNEREKFFAVRAASDTHPATRLLADFQRLDLDRARIYRRFQFDPFSGKDVSVLLQESNGEGVVVERRLGRGRVLVQAVPLGISWSTLPLCQAYVPLLHEWFWYLSEPNLPLRNLSLGQTLAENAPSPDSTAELRLPDGRIVTLPAEDSAAGPQFRFPSLRLPGPYTAQFKSRTGAPATSRFYVFREPQESDLKAWTAQDRERIAGLAGFKLDPGLNRLEVGGEVAVPQHPLEAWLLAALALALCGEMLLGGWLTHRRHARAAKPVIMEGIS